MILAVEIIRGSGTELLEELSVFPGQEPYGRPGYRENHLGPNDMPARVETVPPVGQGISPLEDTEKGKLRPLGRKRGHWVEASDIAGLEARLSTCTPIYERERIRALCLRRSSNGRLRRDIWEGR